MDGVPTLREVVPQLLATLQHQGYADETIRQYRTTYRSLMVYAEDQGVSQYTEALGLAFMNDRFHFRAEDWLGPDIPPKTTATWHRLVMLWHFQQTASVVGLVRRRKQAFRCPVAFTEAHQAFQACCDRKQYSAQGQRSLVDPVEKWLIYLDNQQVSDLNALTSAHCSGFLARYAGHSPRYLGKIISALRTFLRSLGDSGLITGTPWKMLPSMRIARQAFIPASWPRSDVERLLQAIDRGNPMGKRDYALLLLVTRLGLRASDVRNLTFRNLDWPRKRIVLVQTKTKRPLELPLLDDVGWALIDYLKNGRPRTAAEEIFVNHKAPYDRFRESNGLQRILRKYMQFAGLEIPRDEHCGLHALRSTLARTLLEQGTPLPVISDVLGHESAQSARSYLKINLEALRRCPLDPEAVFDHDV